MKQPTLFSSSNVVSITKAENHRIKLHGLTKETVELLYKHFSYVNESTKYQDKKRLGTVTVTHLFKRIDKTIPSMFLFDVCSLLKENEIHYKVDDSLKDVNSKEVVSSLYEGFLNKDFKKNFIPHEHQVKAITTLLRRKKGFVEISTSGGKSFVIYVLAGIMALQGNKVLILTDTTALIRQLKEDIKSYSKNPDYWEEKVKCIYSKSGDDKRDPNGSIFISTYASMNEDDFYFKRFDMLLVDEAHKAVGNSITDIIRKTWNAPYRIGMTGSLNGTKEHLMRTTDRFGQVVTLIKARELINKNLATDFSIKQIYIKRERSIGFNSYNEYISYLTHDYNRTNFIVEYLRKNDKRNIVLLFNRIVFGKKLFSDLKDVFPDRRVEYISGETSVDERMRIKESFQERNDVILVASYKTIATGINAPNLRTILMAEPLKATITVVQSIGRTLRKYKGKEKAELIDLYDSLGWGEYHAKLRREIYQKEEHPYSHEEVNIELSDVDEELYLDKKADSDVWDDED